MMSLLKRDVFRAVLAICCGLALFASPPAVGAQVMNNSSEMPGPSPTLLQNVRLDQKLGEEIPLDLNFTDEHGQTVSLRQFFSHGPVVLSLAYFQCTMLCGEVLSGLDRTLRELPLTLGKDYTALTVSFDPTDRPEVAAEKHALYAGMYGRPGAEQGWHFLTGQEPAIKKLTDAVGFHYVYDPASRQFAHPSGVFVLTREGRLSRYFYGVVYPPRDMRLALIEASQNTIGSRVDQVLLYCYHFDARTGKYSLVISRVIQLGGAATLLGLAALISVLFWKEKRSLPAKSMHFARKQGSRTT